MTEEQARTKWCPMYGISTKEYVDDCCIASQCMFWRWRQPTWDDKPKEGYCGLAGKE
jgi:hypothetical protein